MKTQWERLPGRGAVALAWGAALLAWGGLVLLAGKRGLVPGIAAIILGTAAGAGAVCWFYGRVRHTVMELDRACRTRLLEKYLGGDVPPEGDLTEAMPGLQSEYFAVAVLQCIDFSGYLPHCGEEHIPHTAYLQVDLWMRDAVTRRLRGISRPYFVPIEDGMEILINVTGLEGQELDRASREKAAEICGGLSLAVEDLKAHGLVCGAVLSTVCCGREDIVLAHKEAQELTMYAELMGDSSPVKNAYDQTEHPVELSDKLRRMELEQRFMQAVTNRNYEQLEKIMDGFVELELRTASRYPDLLKNRLIMHMEQMLSAFSISVVDYEPEEAQVVGQFRLLMDMTSAQQLRQQCTALIHSLRDFQEARQGRQSHKATKALKFIDDHYADPGICADQIGDALGVSAAYVSRMLKQSTGLGVVDHIHRARLQRAKELLTDTQLSLDEVAQQVGFSSRFTLTRSFKRYEEMTPGAWRELHGKKS